MLCSEHRVAESTNARFWIVLVDLVDARHLESVVQVPFQERCVEQDLITTKTAHVRASWTRHDEVISCWVHGQPW